MPVYLILNQHYERKRDVGSLHSLVSTNVHLQLIYTGSIAKLSGHKFYMHEKVLFISGATKLNSSFNFKFHVTAFVIVELQHVSVSQIAHGE
jgi:hypothetical protein